MFVTDTVAHLIQQLDRWLRGNAVFYSINCHVRMPPALKIREVGNDAADYTADAPRIYCVFAIYFTLGVTSKEESLKLSIGTSNEGISITFGSGVAARLERNPRANQSQPRRSYVYAHLDEHATPFYIGKGVGRRAWDGDRHPLWHRYVERHLQGKYSVVILEDDLSPAEAEKAESAWIAQETETLVNWINMSRRTDFKALGCYHELRNANLALFAAAKDKEKTDLEEAIALYQQSLARLEEYASIQPELGLIGKLLAEEVEEIGLRGELQILDRLTLCLVRLGRGSEACEAAARYFASYRADVKLSAAAAIQKRVNKARASLNGAL